MVKWDKDRDLDSNRGKNILGTAEQGQRGRNRRNVTQTGINRQIAKNINSDRDRRTSIEVQEQRRGNMQGYRVTGKEGQGQT